MIILFFFIGVITVYLRATSLRVESGHPQLS